MFPQLTDVQRAHAQRVAAALQQLIADAGGWISFADYMHFALYTPGLGYYSAGAKKFGAAGDFVTAPEISPLFAPLVGVTIGDVLRHVGRTAMPRDGNAVLVDGGAAADGIASDGVASQLLELGAGSGRFAAEALRALADAQSLPQRYDILEVSADLRERQQTHLAASAHGGLVHWLDVLPQRMRGVIFANEVLDALPTERFVMQGGRPSLVGVAWDEQGLRACARAGDPREHAIANRLGSALHDLPDGYVGECTLTVEPWIAALAAALECGVILLIDYGLQRAPLYHPQRYSGTLRCFFRHLAHDDPFFRPGLCDLSAWVDFTAVAEAAQSHGLELLGFTTQAAFLLENGIEKLLARDMPEHERAQLAHGARQLLLPGEMGESVKVMALGRAYDGPLAGFSLQDLTTRL